MPSFLDSPLCTDAAGTAMSSECAISQGTAQQDGLRMSSGVCSAWDLARILQSCLPVNAEGVLHIDSAVCILSFCGQTERLR